MSSMAGWIYRNGGFVRDEEAVLHHRDLTVQRGYGVFDFFRLVGQTPLFLDDHLARLEASAAGLHLALPTNRQQLADAVREVIKRGDLSDTGIRITLTGGYSADGFTPANPNVIIAHAPFKAPTPDVLAQGIQLLPYPFQRQLSHLKTTDYLTAIWLQPRLNAEGFDDALYHHNGWITECPRSNFFLVTGNGVLVTPAEGMLKGITRGKVLELAKELLPVEERPVHLGEIRTASEAFVTSTTKQILPVARVADVVMPERSISFRLAFMFCEAYSNA